MAIFVTSERIKHALQYDCVLNPVYEKNDERQQNKMHNIKTLLDSNITLEEMKPAEIHIQPQWFNELEMY